MVSWDNWVQNHFLASMPWRYKSENIYAYHVENVQCPDFCRTHLILICKSIFNASRSLQTKRTCYLTSLVAPVTASGILTRISWWWVQSYPASNLELHNWEIRIIINPSILSIFNPIRLLKYTPGALKDSFGTILHFSSIAIRSDIFLIILLCGRTLSKIG